MQTITITLGDRKVKRPVIKNIETFRGFYGQVKGVFFEVGGYNTHAIQGLQQWGYSLGFQLSHGDNVVEHLFNKLKASEKLTHNESEAFYEAIRLRSPIAKVMGMVFDFRGVLSKLPNVQFWTLEVNMSKREKEIYKDSPVYADELN